MPFRHLRAVVRSLRFRLTLWNTLVVLLVGVLALISVRQGLHFVLLHETDAVLRDEAEEILLAVEQFWPDDEAVRKELQRKSAVHEQNGWFVQLLDGANHTVWASPLAPDEIVDGPFVHAAADDVLSVGEFRVVTAELRRPGLPHFLVRVGTSTRFIDRDVAQVTRIAAPVAVVVVLLAPLGGYILSGRATRPLRKIIDATERLHPDRLTDRLTIRGTGDELDQLSQKINAFLDQIARHLEQNREFVANAAHELRSPLAAIQSSVEVALSRGRSEEQYEELLNEISEECARLTTLVNQLLLLAESDAGCLELARDPIRLADIVERSLDMFDGVAAERGIELDARLDGDVVVIGAANRLRQVVNNLLDNAIKFTPAGGTVTVTLRKAHAEHPDAAMLIVADTGIGIPVECQPRVFERFYQVDPSRQRGTQDRGGGLGLSICQSIVRAHGGSIAIDSEPGSGTRAIVRLPLAAPADASSATAANGRPVDRSTPAAY